MIRTTQYDQPNGKTVSIDYSDGNVLQPKDEEIITSEYIQHIIEQMEEQGYRLLVHQWQRKLQVLNLYFVPMY